MNHRIYNLILISSFLILNSLLLIPGSAHAGLLLNAPNYVGLNSGLVGYWSFNGPDVACGGVLTAYDRSGKGYNATQPGGVGITCADLGIGKIGQGLNAFGKGHLEAGDITEMHQATRITLAGWFREYNNGITLGSQIGCDNSFLIEGGTGDLSLTILDGVGGCFGNHITKTYERGVWHFIAFVFDGTKSGNSGRLRGYFDGVQQSLTYDGTVPASLAPAGGEIKNFNINWPETNDVGSCLDGTNCNYASYDEIRLYNRALSAQEIKRLYNIGGTLKIGKSQSTGTLSQGLVGWWTFEDSDIAQDGSSIKVYDRSGKNNTASSSGPIIPKKAIGKIGQGVSFDGVDDYLEVAGTAALGDLSSNGKTVSAWFRTAATEAGTDDHIVMKTTDTGSHDWGLFVDANNGFKLGWTTNDGTSHDVVSDNGGYNDNKWHHAVGVFDGSKNIIYVDGVLQSGATAAGTKSGDTCSLFIGMYGSGCSVGPWIDSLFKGFVDDVRIYNRALLPDEIKRLYNIGGTLKINKSLSTGSLSQGLVGWWTFEDSDMAQNGNSIKVYDKSGNNNTASSSGDIIPKKTIGKIGQGLSFDGVRNYIQTATGSIAYFDNSTISVWVKPTQRALTMDPGIYAEETSTNDVRHSVGIAGGLAEFCIFRTGPGFICAGGGQQLSANTWYNIVGVLSSSGGMKLYVNGILDATNSNTLRTTAITNNSKIGADDMSTPQPNEWCDCTIDEIRTYNRALTLDEIRRLYLMGGGR